MPRNRSTTMVKSNIKNSYTAVFVFHINGTAVYKMSMIFYAYCTTLLAPNSYATHVTILGANCYLCPKIEFGQKYNLLTPNLIN